MAALFSKFITLVLLVLCSYSSLANEGQRVGFTIEENGTVVRQEALVQEGRVFIANPGGDPVTDLVYDSGRRELLIINHQSKSYYRIDDSVIQKAASML